MKLSLISFTPNGARLCREVLLGLSGRGYECEGYALPHYAADWGLLPYEGNLHEWTKKAFEQSQGVVFVGACGIAVRAIAPFVRDKFTDPAVVSLDEQGSFAVSLLSGHVGGANLLARDVSLCCGAQAVISTATDIGEKFAVDSWAVRHGLALFDRQAAKMISARILQGRPVLFCSDFSVHGALPAGVKAGESGELGFCVSLGEGKKPFDTTLVLVPNIVTVGIGCRKGISAAQVEKALFDTLGRFGVSPRALRAVASIDLKKNEPGIQTLCEKYSLKFATYSAHELRKVKGAFTPSSFVRRTTGVDNVCERSAVKMSGGALIVKKQAANGVTIALAIPRWEVDFS